MTNMSEEGLERMIADHLVSQEGYVLGSPADYDRTHVVDLRVLLRFIRESQPEVFEGLDLAEAGRAREQFLARLSAQVERRGVLGVLRGGLRHGPHAVSLYYGAATEGNRTAAEFHASNIFSVTRQLRYSDQARSLALDMVIFINGLPVATMELKNSLTKQTVADAVAQYKRDRDPREPLFRAGRCMVHFAVDDQEVRMCAELLGSESWFLPFNQGYEHGAGNPPNPNGLKTEYLWKRILARASLADILENYAQDVQTVQADGRRKRVHLFPRYHQLDVVRALLQATRTGGPGRNYLVQHSAGSGKSNSIAWLVHQLVELRSDGRLMFDSIVVVTDRLLLDKQISDTIRQFAQVSAVVGHAENAADLRTLIAGGKKIIITTLQKFPFVLGEVGEASGGRTFAVVIDEAHSSQGGRTANTLHATLADDPLDASDAVAAAMEMRRMPHNVSFFAFTATPKSRTLQLFGTPYVADGETKHRPFHVYSMRQAIDEGFILDVLSGYTPVSSYYRVVQQATADTDVDVRQARRALRQYVEGHTEAVTAKAQVIVEHFHGNVVLQRKIGGRARGMVVANGVDRALAYYYAINAALASSGVNYRALIAFSGEREFRGVRVSEASINGFPVSQTAARFRADEHRLLIVAEKFQTGFDEPLLHSMYVDKPLAGVQAVQTLSRLNRAHPKKRDTFILDFANNAAAVESAFSDYYTTTLLSKDIDPNRLHDLKDALDAADVYEWQSVVRFTDGFLAGVGRQELDPVLDVSVAAYLERLDEVGQASFKSRAKSFVRAYGFLSCLLPYGNPDWERLATYLGFLVGKLPSPPRGELDVDLLDAIDMESFRLEVGASLALDLSVEDAELSPVEEKSDVALLVPQHDLLSAVVASFNEQFGAIAWRDADKVRRAILTDIPERVLSDRAYQNALAQADPQNARIEHDRALGRVLTDLLVDQTELFKQFSDNDSFRGWLQSSVFALTADRNRRPDLEPTLTSNTWDSVVGPFLSNDEVERLPGSIASSLLGLTTRDGFVVYPSFQLKGTQTMPGLGEIRSRWPADIHDQWTMAAWLVSPQGGLNNGSVVQQLWESPTDTALALSYVASYVEGLNQ